jgi:hypothetical protein
VGDEEDEDDDDDDDDQLSPTGGKSCTHASLVVEVAQGAPMPLAPTLKR